jgi:hypothetical protein
MQTQITQFCPDLYMKNFCVHIDNPGKRFILFARRFRRKRNITLLWLRSDPEHFFAIPAGIPRHLPENLILHNFHLAFLAKYL